MLLNDIIDVEFFIHFANVWKKIATMTKEEVIITEKLVVKETLSINNTNKWAFNF